MLLISEPTERETKRARMLKSAAGKPRRHSPDVPRPWVWELFFEESLCIAVYGPGGSKVADTIVKWVFIAPVPPLLVYTCWSDLLIEWWLKQLLCCSCHDGHDILSWCCWPEFRDCFGLSRSFFLTWGHCHSLASRTRQNGAHGHCLLVPQGSASSTLYTHGIPSVASSSPPLLVRIKFYCIVPLMASSFKKSLCSNLFSFIC